MRAIVVHPGPDYSVADVHNGWLQGLRACGVDAREFNLHDRLAFYSSAYLKRDGEFIKAFSDDAATDLAAQALKAACYEWLPDLVLLVSYFFVPPQIVRLVRSRGSKVAAVFTESPYQESTQLDRLDGLDACTINDPTNIDRYREHLPVMYAPHCYDPAVHYPAPGPKSLQCDVSFVGTGYPSRVGFLEAVDWSGLDVKLAGHWRNLNPDSVLAPMVVHDTDYCWPNDRAADLYRASSSSLNLYRVEALAGDTADGFAVGPREVELAACGTWFARQSRPEGDELFPMLPTFESPGELGDLLRWAKAHPDARSAAASAAREAVADRTFPNNARQLLELLGF